MSENMRLWDLVCKTNPKDTKGFNAGFKGTAICAQSQRKKATEVFGAMGCAWGTKNDRFDIIETGSSDARDNLLVYTGILYYSLSDNIKGEIFICGDINLWNNFSSGWKKNNDPHKKVRTDAITKGLSELGFNSDVFEGKFDDSKYVRDMDDHFNAPPPEPEVTLQEVQELATTKLGNSHDATLWCKYIMEVAFSADSWKGMNQFNKSKMKTVIEGKTPEQAKASFNELREKGGK